MNILVVKLGALGDVVRTTSLLKPLRARHPGCRIWWATSPAAKSLLENNLYIHTLLTVDGLSRLPRGVRFDLVLSLEEDARVAELAAEHCRGEFVGVFNDDGALKYTDSSARYYAMSLLNRDPDGELKTANALKAKNRLTYAELWLEILGLPMPKRRDDLAPVLKLTARDRRAAGAIARRHGIRRGQAIGVNPGAGRRWPAKQISAARAAGLLDALHRRFGRPILLFGGRYEARRNREIARWANAPVIDAGTSHGLRAFAGLLELCGALVTTDSLALHLAAALRVPTVALAGPTSSAELDLFGCGRILKAPRCSCFYLQRCRLKASCLDRMPDAAILRAVKTVSRFTPLAGKRKTSDER